MLPTLYGRWRCAQNGGFSLKLCQKASNSSIRTFLIIFLWTAAHVPFPSLQACFLSSPLALSWTSTSPSAQMEPGWGTTAVPTCWTITRSPLATGSSPHPRAVLRAWETRCLISSAALCGGTARCASTGTWTWKRVCGSSTATTTCPSCSQTVEEP